MADERTMVVILLTVLMPDGWPNGEYEPTRRVLRSDKFLDRLRHAVRDLIQAYPELARVRVDVSGRSLGRRYRKLFGFRQINPRKRSSSTFTQPEEPAHGGRPGLTFSYRAK